MKKALFFLFILAFAFASCATVAEITPEEAFSALREAGNLAAENAFVLAAKKTEGFSFVPPSLSAVLFSLNEVPGLGLMLDNWRQSALVSYAKALSCFPEFIKRQIKDLSFEDPLQMLKQDDSVTSLLESRKFEEIQEFAQKSLRENLDLGLLQKILDQYNDYLLALGRLDGVLRVPLESDPVPELAKELSETYLSQMKIAEQKARTTPDLGLDENYVKVFGLGI